MPLSDASYYVTIILLYYTITKVDAADCIQCCLYGVGLKGTLMTEKKYGRGSV